MAENRDSFLHLLYQSQYDKLLKAAYRMTGDLDSAQDLVQQVFLIALVRQSDISAHPMLEGWLMLTLKNLVKNERRRQNNHPQVSLEDIAELAVPASPDSLEHSLPKELSPVDREILIWRFERQMDYKEMADRLGISEAACRSRVSRAIANYRQYMSKQTRIKKFFQNPATKFPSRNI